jgi:lambda family phage tail tape measure protein
MENTISAASLGAQSFQAFIGNMNSALDKFVDTGKFSFSDFANSIIRDMIKIQLRAQAMQLFNMAGNSIFGGALGGVFGSSSGVGQAYGGGTPGAVSLTGHANGGTVAGGSPYMIGERGPELFVPSASGTVIPTNNLASAMAGGGGQTVNYNGPYIANMSAIDTQTGVLFLAKNKQTIWASYQSANLSVPVSR